MPSAMAASGGNGGNRPDQTTVPDFAIVQFNTKPMADYTGDIAGLAATAPAIGHKLNVNSAAANAYGRYLAGVHQSFSAWLHSNAPQVQVIQEYSVVFDGVAVLLNGRSADSLRAGPDVRDVVSDWLYRPSMDVSVPLIRAPQVWSTLGVDLSGTTPNYGSLAAIKVGVVDTGILDSHPFIASCRASNPVVHRGPFFSGLPFGTPIVFDHGTHVSGTIGGCKMEGPVNVSGTMLGLAPASATTLGFLSGVAPDVTLFDYNVFPGMGVGFYILGGSAFSHDIITAVEQAVIDGMDVINLSLGGGVQGPHDVLADALNAAVDAGVVAAIAAGNSGPGTMTVESPGSAANVITAGASTDPHYMGISVTPDSSFGLPPGTTFGAAIGAFHNFVPVMTAAISTTSPAQGCSAISTGLSGKIAVIDRGVCTFGTKIQNAQDAGAAGVIIVNNVFGDPISMGADSVHNPIIPAAMVSKADGAILKAHSGSSITVDGTSIREIVTSNADFLAGFSSRGPTPYTFLIKPDVTAPGVNVLSSIFTIRPDGTYAPSYAFFQGTSMATPHTTGAAALLLAAHPDWSPEQVKSALVNTADRPVKSPSSGAPLASPLSRGGGRINVWSADHTPATLFPASVSFGVSTGGEPVDGAIAVAFHDETGSGLTCSLTVTQVQSGTMWTSVSPASLTVPAGGSAMATVTLSGGQSIPSGFFFGDVVAACGSTTLRAPWFVGVQRSNGGLNGNLNGGLSDVDAIPADLLAQMAATDASL
jgi:minor extracellular serine protease Vpr